MPDFSNLTEQLRALDSMLAQSWNSTQDLQNALQQLSQMKASPGLDPEHEKEINRKIAAIKEYMRVEKDAHEQERKNLEGLTTQNKQLLELLDKTILRWHKGAEAIGATTRAYSALKEKGDIGRAIQQVTALSGHFKWLGFVIGETISAYVKYQDRVQLVNKTIIDSTAATGQFARGLEMSRDATKDLTTGIRDYAQYIGISSDRIQEHISSLGKLGFTLEEIGIDEASRKVTTLTDSIEKNAEAWGALSVSISAARATGLSASDVMAQMQMQVKTLGGDVKDVARTFASLADSAARSKLSTSILLPVVRGAQDAFKFLGIDSAEAARSIGAAGEAAEQAGLGAEAAVSVMGRAMAGLAGMDFGMMTFMGQQLQMGGGLAAGFRFRQQAADRPGGTAMQIAQVIGRVMGGTGELITEEQARTNEQLASLRLAQEQFAQQTFGFSQNEARAYLNLATELERLQAVGKGQTDESRDIEKQLKGMELGEGEYRARTLTMQEKIAQILELISSLIGRAIITFIRAFVGRGAESEKGLAGLLSKAFKGIEEGKGLDEIFRGEKGGFHGVMERVFEEDVYPAAEAFGDKVGGIFKTFFGSWPATITTILGGMMIGRVISRGLIGGLVGGGAGAAGGGLLGNLLRGLFGRGGGAGGTAGRWLRGLMGERIVGRGAFTIPQAAQQAAQQAEQFTGVGFGTRAMNQSARRASTALGRVAQGAGKAARGFGAVAGRLLGAAGLVAAAGALGYALGSLIRQIPGVSEGLDDLATSQLTGIDVVEKMAAATNRFALAAVDASNELAKISGFTSAEAARRAAEEVGGFGVLAEEIGEKETRASLAQFVEKHVARIQMGERTREAGREMMEKFSFLKYPMSHQGRETAAQLQTTGQTEISTAMQALYQHGFTQEMIQKLLKMKTQEARTQYIMENLPPEVLRSLEVKFGTRQERQQGQMGSRRERIDLDIHANILDERMQRIASGTVRHHIDSGDVPPGRAFDRAENIHAAPKGY